MKKLFLTSGFVFCMAVPAFATGISSDAQNPMCDYDTLGVYEGDANLEAIWVPNIGTITLNSNVYPSNNTASAPLYAVSGWTTPAVTNATPVVTAANPATLYSVYAVGVYSTRPTDQTLSSYTTSNRLTGVSVPSITGYTFDGFYSGNTQLINSNGSIQYEAAATQITAVDGTAIWYAHWTPKTTTVAYNCGQSNATSPVAGTWTRPAGWTADTQTATYDTAFSHPTGSTVCSLTGYTFNSWYCVSGITAMTSGGTTHASNGIVNSKWNWDVANVTCTAVWTPNQIGLNWDVDGGTPGSTPGGTSCNYDGPVVLPANPSRTGYTFMGWEVTSVTPATP